MSILQFLISLFAFLYSKQLESQFNLCVLSIKDSDTRLGKCTYTLGLYGDHSSNSQGGGMRKLLVGCGVVIVVLVCFGLVGGGLDWSARQSFPKVSGS
jgi:hypothetical protein